MTDDLTDDQDWALLAKYAAGLAGGAERARVERWLAADPRRRAMVEELRAAADDAAEHLAPPAADAQSAKAAVWARLEREIGRPAERTVRGGHASRSGPWWAARIAAVLVVAAGGALAVWRGGGGRFTTAQPFREFTSARGSRTTITLRDGTQLVLGPATHLRVPADFGVSARTVTLDGEALFTVAHDTRHPFAVRTARTTVRDVGTTFAVYAYAADVDHRVAVAEGEVALSGVSLRPHDVASLDPAGRITVRRGVDVSRYLAWSHGGSGLVFEDTPLADAARAVSRAYDLDVTIADSTLAGALVTATFEDQPADVVLDVVTRAVRAHYDRAGRAVVIRRGVVPVGGKGRTVGAELRLTRAGALHKDGGT